MHIAQILLAFLVLAKGGAAPHQTPTSATEYALTVSVDGSQPLRLSLDDLAKLGSTKVTLKEHQGSADYVGAPLIDVLAKAGVGVGDKIRGKALATVVVIDAQDGYKVAFGLGELEPTISGRTIILAYQRDGKPLDNQLGPVRLVIADDKKQARCVRMVTAIRVVTSAN